MRTVHFKISLYAAMCVTTAPCLFAAEQYYDASSASDLTAGNAIWDSGTTAAWADSATPGTAVPGLWVDGNNAIFQTGGTSTVTLSGSVSAASLTHASGTTTLAGSGTLTLTNGVILSGGTLNIGSGTSGSLPNGTAITMSPGSILNFGRSDAASWSGRIHGVATTDGTVSKTGTGNLTLTLQGNNTFGTITNTNTSGVLTLATAASTDEIATTIRAATGSSMAVTSGVWNTPNLGVNSTGAQMRGTLTITNATVTATTSGRYATGSYLIQNGGTLRITTDRFEYNTGQSVPTATIEIQNGGLLDVYSTGFGTSLGGGTTQNLTTIVKQSGGTARFGVSNGTSTSNRNLVLGAKANNSKSAYDLSGGTLLVAGTISGDNALNNLNFRGGVLAANAITTAKLGYSTDANDPVANSTSVGTSSILAATLAPGDSALLAGPPSPEPIRWTPAGSLPSTSAAPQRPALSKAPPRSSTTSPSPEPPRSAAVSIVTCAMVSSPLPPTASPFSPQDRRKERSPIGRRQPDRLLAGGHFQVTVNSTSVVLSDYQAGTGGVPSSPTRRFPPGPRKARRHPLGGRRHIHRQCHLSMAQRRRRHRRSHRLLT
jgi:hypothetical protein